jgi:nucleotide-binding universal stress UspA family protein
MHKKPFLTIGIGVTLSPNLPANIAEASRLALKMESRLILIHVGNKTPEKENQFRECLKDYILEGGEFEIIYQPGDPVSVILEMVKKIKIDLLIIGALKRENIVKYYLGSIARKITRKATCSVLLLINPSINRVPCKHIVVNGLEDPRTQDAIKLACYMGCVLESQKLTIVEEISRDEIGVKIDDDKTLQMATLMKEERAKKENLRVKDIVSCIPKEYTQPLSIQTQAIFGKRGYSISHYSEIVRADLLVMNASKKSNFWDVLFPHDMEHILSELPTDLLIVQ